MASHPSYAIVLSTYNGAAFLTAQIESIRAQTIPNWRLYIRDDGSVDQTPTLIEQFAAEDARISLVADGTGNLGAPASFGSLLSYAMSRGENYVFLSDQDDVWLPDKAARMLGVAAEYESCLGSAVPLLVHSDLRVVSSELDVIHPSYFRFQRIDPQADVQLPRLALRNAVTGCATLVNRALLEYALPFPRIVMHDWWLAECAALFGQVALVEQPTVLYRQHRANALGARGLLGTILQALLTPRSWWGRGAQHFLLALDQLWDLRRRADAARTPGVAARLRPLAVLHDVLSSERASVVKRIRATWRTGAVPSSLSARALILTWILLLPLLRARFSTIAPSRRISGGVDMQPVV
jgi:rhamnosyltransferase